VVGLRRSLMYLGELANGDEVVWRGVEDAKKLGTRILQTAKLEQGPTECHPRREIGWMLCQSRLAYPNGFFAVSRPPVLLGKLRKSNRRRILLDPASKVFNPRFVHHHFTLWTSLTSSACSIDQVRPAEFNPGSDPCYGVAGGGTAGASGAPIATALVILRVVPVMSVTVKVTGNAPCESNM
jgi:hypothetical protein